MSEPADARRLRLLEMLVQADDSYSVDELGALLKCDGRTIRRDLDHLHDLLQNCNGIEVRRGRAMVARAGYSPGYFTDQLEKNHDAKKRIAHTVLNHVRDGQAAALTAGSTTFEVAREIRKRSIEGTPPGNLIVFTNSVPSLLQLVAADISTGVLGEIYNDDDCAFHAPEYRSAFQPEIAIVGASGLTLNTATGAIELYSHRAEEAAFLKQLLHSVPEIILAVDSFKIGRRHPWSFGGSTLHAKRLLLVTDFISTELQEDIGLLTERMRGYGTQFRAVCAHLEDVDSAPSST